jgi:hypothetical protein
LRAAAGFALDGFGRVFMQRVDGDLGAQPAGQRQLFLVDVHRGHVQPHGHRILHRHVAQPANAADRHRVAGLGVGHLQAFVHGDARAQHRGDLGKAHASGRWPT